ncbi:MAG TPA: aconitase X [Thermodesulfovibrionales bacterium]|nr:aconitase X [Thermodesulfovibrionales bacterium]
MELTKDEEKMLSGKYGEGYRRAMEILVKLGEFYDAKRLVPISLAYLVVGPSPSKPGKASEWLHEMADLGTTFKCPLPLVPVDSTSFSDYELHRKLGAVFAYGGSGHPRNLLCVPVFGQHITADGTAITHYMNSYIGARANTECFVGQYSAAIVGKTPEYGFHLSKNRIGKTLFDVKVQLKDETDWSALGYYISKTLGKNYWDVPVIKGIKPADITHDELVAICSSIPSYGACVHSLLVGISPEARTLEQAFGGKKPKEKLVVGPKELKRVYDTFSTSKEKPDMVSMGGFGVNLSIESVLKLARLFEGKKVSEDFPTVALIDGPVRAVADRTGITDILRAAGVRLSMDEVFKERGVDGAEFTNNPVICAKRMGWNTLVFADAKSCHYIGNQDIEPVLKHIEECVKIALTGKMEV